MKLLLPMLAVSLIILAVMYPLTQGPKLYLNAQQFGFAFTKGHYRSWYLSWCDGYQQEGFGATLYPIRHIRGNKWKRGYRLIPKLFHADMSRGDWLGK